MISHFGTLLSVALGVIALASLAGVGFVGGRVKGLTERADSSDAEAAALRERLKDRDVTIDQLRRELDAEVAKCDTKVAALQSEIGVLSKVVTGEAHLAALQDQLDLHHKTALKELGTVEKTLELMLEALRAAK